MIGADADLGLRVTIDHRVRGRDRDFHLGAEVDRIPITPDRLHEALREREQA